MSDIDFLPASYRQMTVHRKANVWRLAAGGLFVAMIGFSGFYQHMLRRHALADLARTDAAYDRTQALITQQRELKKQLESADCDAQLFAYLRHPWPTTQVLAALKPLPDCITLREIRLFYAEPTPNATAPAQPNRRTRKPPKPFHRISAICSNCEQYDGRSRVLILTGTTHDTAALQKYLSRRALQYVCEVRIGVARIRCRRPRGGNPIHRSAIPLPRLRPARRTDRQTPIGANGGRRVKNRSQRTKRRRALRG